MNEILTTCLKWFFYRHLHRGWLQKPHQSWDGPDGGDTVHELRCIPPYFWDVFMGRKTFEVRRNDRNFQVGDKLYLREYDPITKTYTGRSLDADIYYITDFAQKRGFVVMAIRVFNCANTAEA